jgi:hypothetical protein
MRLCAGGVGDRKSGVESIWRSVDSQHVAGVQFATRDPRFRLDPFWENRRTFAPAAFGCKREGSAFSTREDPLGATPNVRGSPEVMPEAESVRVEARSRIGKR